MKKFVMFVLLVVVLVLSGCTVDKKCPVPGCSHKHSTHYSYTIEKVGKKVAFGEAQISLDQWMGAWDLDTVEEVNETLSHLRYFVHSAEKGMDISFRQKGFSDADMTWSVTRSKIFLHKRGK